MRTHPRDSDPPMQPATMERLLALLETRYPGKVRRVVEVCPVAVWKTVDNEHDAKATIANLELAARNGE